MGFWTGRSADASTPLTTDRGES